jgi:protein-L-isoaspartate O-methyltransferase
MIFLTMVGIFISFLLIAMYASQSTLCNDTLRADLRAVHRVFGDIPRKAFTSLNTAAYYHATTGRDYRWMRYLMGSGMHTQLRAPQPIGTQGRGTRQAFLILSEIRAAGAKAVLEVGIGRGYCTLLMAAAAPDVHFWGIDLLPGHVAAASQAAAKAGLMNVTFIVADATARCPKQLDRRFDVIFGCESLCHVGAPVAVSFATSHLKQGGRLVIVDGFRSATFDVCSTPQRSAMALAEFGFRINAMPSKAQWIREGRRCGLRILRDLDWTDEALPFWTLGWRLARVLLLFPTPLRWFIQSTAKRRQTGNNILAVAMVAHAMRDRSAAEYGMLVLRKGGHTAHNNRTPSNKKEPPSTGPRKDGKTRDPNST